MFDFSPISRYDMFVAGTQGVNLQLCGLWMQFMQSLACAKFYQLNLKLLMSTAYAKHLIFLVHTS